MDKDWKKSLKPASYADYIAVGPIIVYRRLWVLLVFLLLSGVLAVAGVPMLLREEKAQTMLAVDVDIDTENAPMFHWEDAALEDYTGLARIQDVDGVVRYAGEVKDGACTGQGTVFSPEGTPVYEGELLDNQYEGKGKHLDTESNIVSEGEFVAGAFTGEGKQYDADVLLREGMFTDGILSGVGTEYAADDEALAMIAAVTSLLDRGDGVKPPSIASSADTSKAESKAETASGDGIRLEGSFSNGKLEGAGRVYIGDSLLYIGAFHAGEFQGDGTLLDTETGRIRYVGAFQEGLPNGKGELYDAVGQYYYTGAVYRGEIDLLSFLETSLTWLESAFPIHPLIYTDGEKTAFVYPAQGLAFLTDSPVELIDLDTLAEAGEASDTVDVSESTAVYEEELDGQTFGAKGDIGGQTFWTKGAIEQKDGAELEPLPKKKVLSDRTKPREIQISGIIIAREDYPGLPDEADYLSDKETPSGSEDYFAMNLLGAVPDGYERKQGGEYLTEFTVGQEPRERQRETSMQDGLLVARCTIKEGRYYLVSRDKP